MKWDVMDPIRGARVDLYKSHLQIKPIDYINALSLKVRSWLEFVSL